MSAQKKKEQVDPGSLALLTRQVRHFLAFHQEMGLVAYPALPELRQFLTQVQKRVRKQQPVSSSSQQGRAGHSNSFPKNKPQVARPYSDQKYKQSPAKPETTSVQQQLQMLNQELVQCRCCTSDAEPRIIPGQGSPTPRLMVVGDYFIGNSWEQGLLWGKEEDAMLWRMMQAIGLGQKSVYVTNAIKCPQTAPVQSGSAQEQACFSHLERELQIIRPKLICAMGDAACRSVLKTKAPLARLRGRFHTYKYSTGAIGKIMPTYHPRLLLQHPEMKQATWKDLQAVQRALQASWP
ncbi:uracil-DNA glycosylase [Candidatus Electrothrix sp.]|uniref:uracil-DNA glycosylase n=1 Tax=Candidatus Electrothrix sp. TaxID=2170559 RepID=UPI004057C1F4